MRIEYRQLMNAINKDLDEWEEYNLESNETNMYMTMLDDFYSKIGKNPKRRNRFSTRLKLTPEQEEELVDMAISFGLSDKTNLDNYINMFDVDTVDLMSIANYDKPINIDAFTKMKENYPEFIEDIQDYIHFFDSINLFKSDKLLTSILSSDQYVNLLEYGRDDITETDVYDLIKKFYNKEIDIYGNEVKNKNAQITYNGETGNSLYNIILEMIQ